MNPIIYSENKVCLGLCASGIVPEVGYAGPSYPGPHRGVPPDLALFFVPLLPGLFLRTNLRAG